jgi:hypothetical protein
VWSEVGLPTHLQVVLNNIVEKYGFEFAYGFILERKWLGLAPTLESRDSTPCHMTFTIGFNVHISRCGFLGQCSTTWGDATTNSIRKCPNVLTVRQFLPNFIMMHVSGLGTGKHTNLDSFTERFVFACRYNKLLGKKLRRCIFLNFWPNQGHEEPE